MEIGFLVSLYGSQQTSWRKFKFLHLTQAPFAWLSLYFVWDFYKTFTYIISVGENLPPGANCWLLAFVLSNSSAGSTKFSGRGQGHVLDRARVWGSKPTSRGRSPPSWSMASPLSVWVNVGQSCAKPSIMG